MKEVLDVMGIEHGEIVLDQPNNNSFESFLGPMFIKKISKKLKKPTSHSNN